MLTVNKNPKKPHAISDELLAVEISARKREIIEWLKAIIRFPSENRFPKGYEKDAQDFIEKECKKIGLVTDVFLPNDIQDIENNPSWLSGRDYSNGRNNVVALWKGTGKGKSLLFSSHVDVAPFEPDNWKITRPYDPIEIEGRLYGRGAVDMKGGMAVEYWAIRILKETGFKPSGDIIFESVVDEEFAGGNGTLASRLRGHNADLAILAEPTMMDVCSACQGAFLGEIIVRGDPGMPFLGNRIANPIEGAARVIDLFRDWEYYWDSINSHRLFKKPEGALKLLLWDIDSKTYADGFTQLGSPHSVKISWVVWSYPGTDEKSFYEHFNKFWSEHFNNDTILKCFNIEIKPAFHYVKPWETESSDEIVKRFADVYRRFIKKEPVFKGAAISCDMAIYGEQGGMPVLIIGPRGGNIHSSDEWVCLDDVFKLTGLFAALAVNLCS